MNIINLTAHKIGAVCPDGSIQNFEPSGQIARVAQKTQDVGVLGSVPLVVTEYGAVEGLPAPEQGTFYLVSVLVLNALQALGSERKDVLSPNTSPDPQYGVVRDPEGKIVGVKSFITL